MADEERSPPRRFLLVLLDRGDAASRYRRLKALLKRARRSFQFQCLWPMREEPIPEDTTDGPR